MIVVFLLVLLFPSFAEATTYWVSPAGGQTVCANVDGDTDPGVYMTLAQIDTSNCAIAGDTVMFKAGTYTGTHKRMDLLVPSGTSAANPSRVLCEGDRTCTLAFSTQEFNFGGILMATNVNHYVMGLPGNGFIVDGVNAGDFAAGGNLQITVNAIYTNVTVRGNTFRNHHTDGFTAKENHPTGYYTNVNLSDNIFENIQSPVNTENGQAHQIYVKGDNWIVERNVITNDKGYGIQCYHVAANNVFRYNKLIMTGKNAFVCQDIDASRTPRNPTNNLFYGNTARSTNGAGTCYRVAAGASGTKFYNNTCNNFSAFVDENVSSVNVEIKNNLCTNGTCNFRTCTNSGSCTVQTPTVLVCGGTCTTTNPTVTAASHFRDAANDDYSLIAGSSQINAGLDVGLSFNGSLPDRGAHETFAPSGATISTNTLDVTIAQNTRSPLQLLSGTTGWSVNCTGTGCGTPVVAAVNILSGSSSVVRLTLSGITGTDCAAGQTWTWSYNGTTGNVQDQALIGGNMGQRLFTYSTQAVTNNCGAASSAYPAGYHLWYQLDDGTSGTTPTSANDESANNLDGTMTGSATWNAMGKSVNSITLTPDSGQYLAVPFGSGFNPSTTSLTVAFWVKVTSGRETLNKSYFGATFGTGSLFYITTRSSTWVLGIQSSGDSSANGTSDLSVEPGVWTHLCLVADSATDTATLYKNGVAGTAAGVVKSYTSYTFPGNFELGRMGNVATGGGADFDDFIVYQSVQSCDTLYRVREPQAPTPVGTFTQVGHQFGLAYKTPAGAWATYGALNTTGVEVIKGGAVSLVTQIDCTVADCAATGMRYMYSRNGGAFALVPDTMTSDEIQFFGTTGTTDIFTGAADRLSGALTETKGQTHLTSNAANFDLPQNGSFTWRGVFRFGSTASGTYCFKSYDQTGVALNGGYSPSSGACVTLVNPMGSAF